MTIQHPHLTVIAGDATSASDVSKVVQGTDVVISAVGQPPRAKTHIMELVAKNILESNPAKFILISSLGIGGSATSIRCILSLVAGSGNINDAEAADRLGCSSTECPWIVVRPAGLSDAPGTGKYLATEATGASLRQLSRADVAQFLLDALTEKKWERKAIQLYAAK